MIESALGIQHASDHIVDVFAAGVDHEATMLARVQQRIFVQRGSAVLAVNQANWSTILMVILDFFKSLPNFSFYQSGAEGGGWGVLAQ